MKKTKIVINIIKDILLKSCVYFTVITLILTAGALLFAQDIFAPYTSFMFALAALGAGLAVQVFKITGIPAVSRHIAFFILLYIDFFLVFIPLRHYTATPNTTFFLSVFFIVIYLVILGIVTGIKSVINAAENRKLKYEKQFKNVNISSEEHKDD